MPDRPITVTFQVVADGNWTAKFKDPNFWSTYKLYVIREITEGALDTVRKFAAGLWVNPSGGGLDQSWFSHYDVGRSLGFISNSKPYAYWLNYGVRPHRMAYLLNAKNAWYLKDGTTKAVTIPLMVDGKKTFRVMTAEHLKLPDGVGPWWHRGIDPNRFAEGGFLAEGMRRYVATRLQADYKGLMVRVLNLT